MAPTRAQFTEHDGETDLPPHVDCASVAHALDCTRQYVFNLYRRGVLKGKIIGRPPGASRGGILRFRLSDVQKFLEGKL